MTNNKIKIARRKLIGKNKIQDYRNEFSSIQQISMLDIEDTDIILQKLRDKKLIRKKVEIIKSLDIESFIDSIILKSIYLDETNSSECYTFSDYYFYCGIFIAYTKDVIKECLFIARSAFNNTCFILDKNYRFYLRINYYDFNHNDDPDSYDIQVSYYF